MTDTEKFKKGYEEGDLQISNVSIPILMQNKVPEGYETDEKLNVNLRPQEVCLIIKLS